MTSARRGARTLRHGAIDAAVLAMVAALLVLAGPGAAPSEASTVPATLLVTSFEGSIAAIDSGSDTVVAGPTTLGGASFPWAMAITPGGKTAYVAGLGSNNVTPVTVSTLAPGTNLCLPVGECPSSAAAQPQAVAVTPDGSAAYVVDSGLDQVSVVLIDQQRVGNAPIHLPAGTRPSAVAIAPDGRTAWVAAYATGQVFPIAIPSGQVGTPFTVGAGPTGLAVSPDGRDLYIANSGAGASGSVSHVHLTASPPTVTTFDPEPTESGFTSPQAIAIAPDGGTVYVTDTVTNRLIPIDRVTDVPAAGVPVGSFPVSVVVSPDGSAVYVANQLGDSVSVLDISGSSLRPAGTISVPAPTALAFVPDQAPVASFTNTSAPAGSPITFDASPSHSVPPGGALTYEWDFGDGTAAGPLSTPTIEHAFPTPGTYAVTLTTTSAAGTSTSQVFTGQTMSRNGGPTARTTGAVTVVRATVGAAPLAFVAAGGADEATPVALTPATPDATAGPPIPVGDSPAAVAITPDGRIAYVADRAGNTVTPITVATAQPGSAIPVGNGPGAIATTPDGAAAYVVTTADNAVRRITVATGVIGPPIPVGNAPSAIAVEPDGLRALVANAADNTITPIDLVTGIAGDPVSATGLVNPVAIAVAPDGDAAYVVSAGTLTTGGGVTSFDLTGSTPLPIRTVAVGGTGARPSAIAVTPDGATAYVATASGSVARVDVSGPNLHLAAVTPVALSLTGVAITPDGSAAYAVGTANSPFGAVPSVIPMRLTSPLDVGTAIAVGADPRGIAITPDQAPIAQLAVSPSGPGAAPKEVSFDAGGSSNPSSPIVRYDWDFGDGLTATTIEPTVRHSYPVAGTYSVSVTLTDAAGTSTTDVFTGQTMSRNGGPVAVATRQVVVTPTVTALNPATGPAETVVTVTGTGFSTVAGETAFAFGAVAGTAVHCSSSTRCTVAAPDGSGTVHVRATVGGQTSAENGPGDAFTYGAAPPPPPPPPPSNPIRDLLCGVLALLGLSC